MFEYWKTFITSYGTDSISVEVLSHWGCRFKHDCSNHHRMLCKMSSSKKFACKGILRQVFICLRAKNPIPPPPLHSAYVYCVFSMYVFAQGKGREGRVQAERRLKGQQFTKLGRKYQRWLTLSPVYKPAAKSFYRSLFDDILLKCL